MLVQILHAFMERFGWISDDAIRQLAEELNLSRADVHGVVSYYHDFRTTPPGRHIVKICEAEACQAMGSRELTEHAKQSLAYDMHESNETSRSSRFTALAIAPVRRRSWSTARPMVASVPNASMRLSRT